jgi:hypothetical protein
MRINLDDSKTFDPILNLATNGIIRSAYRPMLLSFGPSNCDVSSLFCGQQAQQLLGGQNSVRE